MKKITICIPTYNEAENIVTLLGKVNEVSKKIPSDYSLSAIIIDDNSPDGTADIVDKFAADKAKNSLEIEIIRNPGKSGLGRAYIQGFKKAITAGSFAIVEMDADLSHNPEHLLQMIEKITAFDLVIGSRYISGGGTVNWTFKRKFISFMGNLYARMILWKNVHDFTGGYNMYKSEVFTKVDLDSIKSNGYSFQIEMKYRTISAGFKYAEVPIIFADREFGQSKFSGGIIKEAALTPWKLRLGKM